MDKSLAGIPEGILAVTVCDRESDVFDFAAKALAEKRHLLFRVAQNRRTNSEQKKLFEQVAATPVLGHCMAEVPRKPGNNQPPRQARLAVRACLVRIIPPLKRTSEHLSPITLLQEAVEKIGWYRERWKIERFHYILKSGCKVEDLRLETSERLQRAITLYAVIAWRIADDLSSAGKSRFAM